MQNIDNQPVKSIEYDLQIDTDGYPVDYPRVKYVDSKAMPYIAFLSTIADIWLIIKSFPDYDFIDYVSIFFLALPALAFVWKNFLSRKDKDLPDRFLYMDEKEVFWDFNLLDKARFDWEKVEKVEIYTYRVIFKLKNKNKTLTLNRYFTYSLYQGLMQEIKLNIRALSIKLHIPLEEHPDCRAEQEITRKIKKNANN
jgi:hypothetical protein